MQSLPLKPTIHALSSLVKNFDIVLNTLWWPTTSSYGSIPWSIGFKKLEEIKLGYISGTKAKTMSLVGQAKY